MILYLITLVVLVTTTGAGKIRNDDNDLMKEMAELKKSAITSDVHDLMEEVTELKISAIRSDVDVLKDEVADLQSSGLGITVVADIQAELKTLKADNLEVKDAVAGIENDVEEIKNALADMSKVIDAILGGGRQEWHLGMNLNPADGHIMGYTTGWHIGTAIGTGNLAFRKDYLNDTVWREPANYVAIVRHQLGKIDAVKVFKFKYRGISLLSRFRDMNPGRRIVSEGGPIQEWISPSARNLIDDPIFSIGGDLAFNWVYYDNGHRIVLTGAHLSAANVNDDNTHGLGNSFYCAPLDGRFLSTVWEHEISNIQDCPAGSCNVVVQGTDHGIHIKTGEVYGNYAIYVSRDVAQFPIGKPLSTILKA